MNVSLTPDIEPEDLILIAEQSDFYRQTNLNKSRPEIDFSLTATGMYAKLLEHIHTHRYFMGIDQNRPVEWDEGVIHWADHTYRPVYDVIQQQGLLRKFPDRTPADMYLWVMEYHDELEKELGWHLSSDQVAANLSSQFSNNFHDNFLRFKTWLFGILTPDNLESGPATGSWRKQVKKIRGSGSNTNLFANILVPIKNPETCWIALEQAILFAKLENADLLGLYVQPPNEAFDEEVCLTLKKKFLDRCQEVGVSGDFASEVGDPARKIVDRSTWTDLIVANFASHPMTEISSKAKTARLTMLRLSGRPLLAACEMPSQMCRPLLAFDGSPKAKEALYVAAYLVKKHHLPLIVVSAINNDQQASSIQYEARKYLTSHQIKATYVVEKGSPVDVIQDAADTFDCDLLILGSYGFQPLVEIVLGSTVDRLLTKGDRPILICR